MGFKTVSLITIFFILSVLSDQNIGSLETNFLEVPLDHFAITKEPNSFKLRYLIESKFHIEDGPIFVFMGHNEDINLSARNTGFLFEIAPTFNALIVFVEHRYYGESLPFGNETFKLPKNMRYLTTTQVLADFAYVIDHLKLKYLKNGEQNSTSSVIAFGGGYGGNLAVWFRMKYPFSVKGAIASSTPFVHFPESTNCEKFYEKVTQVFEANGHDKCVETIKLSWEVIDKLSKNKTGMDLLSSSLKMCTPLQSAEDINTLIDWLSNIYVKLASFNYNYAANYYTPLPAFPVKIFCDKLTSSDFNDTKGFIENFGKSLEIYTNFTGETDCNNIKSFVEDPAEFAWKYQSCIELITPKCSTDSDMFKSHPWNIEEFSSDCYKNFGFKKGSIDLRSTTYGPINCKYHSNIVFSNGLNDPWSVNGILTNISSTISVYNISTAPHLLDFRASDYTDNYYIINARKNLIDAIKKWLTISD